MATKWLYNLLFAASHVLLAKVEQKTSAILEGSLDCLVGVAACLTSFVSMVALFFLFQRVYRCKLEVSISIHLITVIDSLAALVEPLAVAWHAVDETGIKPGMDALVLGAGPIGLSVVQCLKARGAKQIIVAEVARERQNFAKQFGATRIIDPRSEDVVKLSKELCDGQGPHIALDCAGVAASIKSATLAVRPRGSIVNVAIWEKETPFNPNNLVFGEKKYSAGQCIPSHISEHIE